MASTPTGMRAGSRIFGEFDGDHPARITALRQAGCYRTATRTPCLRLDFHRNALQLDRGLRIVDSLCRWEWLRPTPSSRSDHRLGKLEGLEHDARPHEDLVRAVALLALNRATD